MKRILAFTLCLVMVLGLFTGVASAVGENPLLITLPFSNENEYTNRLGTGLSSSYSFKAFAGTTTPPSRLENAKFSLVDEMGNPTNKLGELRASDEDQWDCIFDTRNAWPMTEGYLRAVVDNTPYDMPISIGDSPVGVYADSDCKEYLPPNSRTLLTSETTTCYIAIVDADDFGTPTVSDSRFTLGTPVVSTNGYRVYSLTAPAGFKGTASVTVSCSGLGDRQIPTITFTDGTNLTLWYGSEAFSSLSSAPVGGQGFTKITYGPDNTELPSDTTFTLRSDENKATLGEFRYNRDRGEWNWYLDSAYPNQSGTLSVTVGGTTYTCPVELGEPDVLVYSNADLTTYVPRNAISASYSKGETAPVFYLEAGNGGEITGMPSCSNPAIQFAKVEDTDIYKMTVDTNVLGQISGEVRIPYDSPSSGGFYNIYPKFRGVIQKETAVDPNAAILNPVASATDAVPFTLDGETYYMSVRLGTLPRPISGDGQYPPMDEGQYEGVVFSIAFFTSPNNGGSDTVAAEYELVDEETLDKIRTAFGDTLSLTVSPAKFVFDDGMTVAAPQYYPEITPCNWPELNAWQQPISLKRGLKQNGVWVLTATGTVNDNGVETPLTHTALSRWHPSPAKFYEFDTVYDLNTWLENCSTLDQNYHYFLTLAAGTHYGQIHVPEAAGDLQITIQGVHDDRYSDGDDDTQYDAYRTILYGGVHASNRLSAYVSDLHMIGAGRNNQKWGNHPNNDIVDANGKDTPNYALTGIFNIGNCIIEEYYHAIDCSGEGNQYTAAADSVFLHNHTALCYNNAAANTFAPNGLILKNIFYENDIAIHFEKIWDQQAMTGFFINENDFISNGTDVQNDEKLDEGKTKHKYSYSNYRWAYLPDNYFGDGVVYDGHVMSGWQTRLCKANHHGNHRLDSPVSAYPQLMRPYHAMQMFRMMRASAANPYELEAEPVLYNITASSYLFPASVLPGKIITLMGSENGSDIVLAQLDFTNSVYTADGDFDPKVSVSRNPDDTEITFTMQDPLNQAPVVRIPCDAGWTAAEAIYNGQKLEATVENGYVSFTAELGGTYTIRPKTTEDASGLLSDLIAGAAGGSSASFSDVPAGAWYAGDVAWATAEGLMNGTGEGRFSPMLATSRAMIVTILWRLEGCPMDAEASSFSDLDASSWYGCAVDWAAAFDIVEGANGKFMPNDAITREQLAAILCRYAAYKGYDVQNTRTGLTAFADCGKVSAYAQAPMQWAVGAGLINGAGDSLLPQGTATRAQTAAILHRFFG